MDATLAASLFASPLPPALTSSEADKSDEADADEQRFWSTRWAASRSTAHSQEGARAVLRTTPRLLPRPKMSSTRRPLSLSLKLLAGGVSIKQYFLLLAGFGFGPLASRWLHHLDARAFAIGSVD